MITLKYFVVFVEVLCVIPANWCKVYLTPFLSHAKTNTTFPKTRSNLSYTRKLWEKLIPAQLETCEHEGWTWLLENKQVLLGERVKFQKWWFILLSLWMMTVILYWACQD